MVYEKDLWTVYELARANKRGSEDAVDFEVHCELEVHNLCIYINEKRYRCDENYTFISPRPKPREVFGCEMASRLIQWYAIWRLGDILEAILTKRTFNNRKGMGTDAAIDRLHQDMIEVSEGFTRDAWVIQWDLQGYFPHAVCEIACQQLQRLVRDYYDGDDKEDLYWMIMVAVHANPAAHCYRKSAAWMWEEIEKGKSLFEQADGIGGAIGFLIWQVAMNLYLDEVDHWAVDEMGLHYVRFVDDTATVVLNKEMALLLLPLFRQKYAEYGITMHPRKFQCQHVNKSIHFLGVYIKCERVYAHDRVIRNARARIAKYNRCRNKEKALQNFLSSINSSFGLLKSGNKSEYNNIKKLLSLIDESWMKYVRFDEDRLCLVARPGYYYNLNMKHRFNQITKI